ncbi:MAG: helix-turn-helix domain-containing protein [Steroidobacteraceae bacterium]
MATSAEKRAQRDFGDALRARRKAEGLTQSDLAEKASLHRTYVSELERGLKEPGFHVLRKLVRALPGSSNELLGLTQTLHKSRHVE